MVALTELTWSYNNVGEDLASDASELYFEKAVEHAEKLKKLAPERALTWFLSAISNGNLGLHRGGKQKVTLSRNVRSDALKAIELDPEFSPGYVVLGVYYREVATLNWALKAIAKSMLGGLPSGSLEDAKEMLLKGVEKDPRSVYAQYQLAVTYETTKKKKAEALAAYKQVVALPATDHEDAKFKKIAAERIKELM